MRIIENTRKNNQVFTNTVRLGNERYLKQKAGASLVFIWISAAVLNFALIFKMNKIEAQNSDKLMKDSDIVNINHSVSFADLNKRIKKESEEVFVFVNLNNKFIITRYPIHESAEKNFASQTVSKRIDKSQPTTRVIKRVKSGKTKDFDIKTAPL